MRYLFALTILLTFIVGTGCGGGPTAIVVFDETIEPKTPLSEDYMHIAVYKAETVGAAEYDQEKWKEMAADMIQASLQRAAEEHNIPIQLVDREHMKIAMAETDMADAGITSTDPATSAIAGASAIITSKVNVKIDKQKGKGTSIDALSAFGSRWGGGGGVSTREVDEIARTITVQCQFQLKANDGSNSIIASYSAPWERHSESAEAGFIFGSAKTEQDLTPRDEVIGAIVSKQIREFMAKFVPVDIREEIEVESSGNEDCELGVQALVIDDWETALARFKKAIAADSEDDYALFGAGVAAEKLGRFKEAHKYYKLARSYEMDEPKYAAAVDRVARRL